MTLGDEIEVTRAARRAVRFVALEEGTDYYAAKDRGFAASMSPVVVFADADCWADDGWLERLTAPLLDDAHPADVAAGRTCYCDSALGIAATTIDFMYFPSPLAEGCTRNFYANNVAFRRSVLETMRFRGEGAFYRGDCQVLGLRLQAAGIPVRFVPEARTVHRFPDSMAEFVRLRLLRGGDAVALSPHLARAYLPPVFSPLAGVRALTSAAALAGRWGFSLRALGHQGMRATKPVETLACVALLSAVSAMDAAGATLKLFHLDAPVTFGQGVANAAVSYHADVDPLA